MRNNFDEAKGVVRQYATAVFIVGGIFLAIMLYVIYTQFRIDVPQAHMAVLVHKTGKDIPNNMELAPDMSYKGVQREVFTEGRYFMNPWNWEWQVLPMTDIPSGKMGILVRLAGENLGYGEFVAKTDIQKGIVAEVLKPGRYPINPWLYTVEADHDPVIIPAGFRGVVTDLSGPIPADPNTILVDNGFRGVQKDTLAEGTYYLNPYMSRVCAVDCRSQRTTISEGGMMGFPSKDGFWVSLDSVIEFRINPKMAAKVYVIYNDSLTGDDCKEQIIKKVILPNARSFCRIQGSSRGGREFISGETRQVFQKEFQESMQQECEPLGIEVIQALVTKINPPQPIADPVRKREVFKQQLSQYTQQILQQDSEIKLAKQKALILQKQALVDAEKAVITKTTKADQDQKVAVTMAEQKLGVAKLKLEAAKDEAAAVLARKEAEAKIVAFGIQAESEGWRSSVKAFDGDGEAFARYVLYNKLAPSFTSIQSNTADSPLMEVFKAFKPSAIKPRVVPVPTPAHTN